MSSVSYEQVFSPDSELSWSQRIGYFRHDFWNDFGDPRSAHLPLLGGGPWKVLAMVALYLWFTKGFGPRFMASRKPFELRMAMITHNTILALGNGLGFLLGLYVTSFGTSCFACDAARSTSPNIVSLREKTYLYGGWLYFMSKFIDFIDTIFFVLRKKDSHISGLHVFHHAFMPFASYIGLKFIPGGNIVLIALVNVGIHGIMYSYYALSAAGPEYQKYLWWKQYLTLAQVLQFILFMGHSIYGMMIPNCSYHIFFHVLELVYAIIFFSMFFSFYRNAYMRGGKKAQSVTQVNGNEVNNNAKGIPVKCKDS